MACLAEEIYAMLVEKSRSCDEFQSTTGLLKKAIETEEMGAVNRLIKRREELMKDIDGLDRRIDCHWHSVPINQCPAIIRQVARISDDISGKLRQIDSDNKDCAAIATHHCESLRNDLTVLNRKIEGLHGYTGNSERMPKFLSVNI
jgi:hypothetical protein